MGEPAVGEGLLSDRDIPRLRSPELGKKHQRFTVKELLRHENHDFVCSAVEHERALQPGVQR